MKQEMHKAIVTVAESEKWHKRTQYELGLLLWCLFRYYAIRYVEDLEAEEILNV